MLNILELQLLAGFRYFKVNVFVEFVYTGMN